MNTVHVKIISTGVIFVVTFLGGYLPYAFLRRFVGEKNAAENKLMLLRCVAGGIFLGTCLVHLLPEALEAMETALGETSYPATEACVGIGFLIMYTVENLILSCRPRVDLDTTVTFSKGDNTAGRGGASSTDPPPEKCPVKRYGSVESDSTTDYSTSESVEGKDEDFQSDNSPLLESTSHVELKVEKPPEVDKPSTSSPSFRSHVLLIALSLHTVFDGLVIGIQDSVSLVWTLLIAMSIHKALVAFSLGLSFLDSHSTRPRAALLYMLFFSLVAPLGAGIGTALTETNFNSGSRAYVSGFLQSLATGTFMFVTFCECLKDELLGDRHLPKVLFVIIGFALVAGLRFAIQED